METMRKNEVAALHNFIKARQHIIQGMMAVGLVENEKDWDARFAPVFDLLCEGVIQTSDEHIDRLTEKAREEVRKITT